MPHLLGTPVHSLGYRPGVPQVQVRSLASLCTGLARRHPSQYLGDGMKPQVHIDLQCDDIEVADEGIRDPMDALGDQRITGLEQVILTAEGHGRLEIRPVPGGWAVTHGCPEHTAEANGDPVHEQHHDPEGHAGAGPCQCTGE